MRPHGALSKAKRYEPPQQTNTTWLENFERLQVIWLVIVRSAWRTEDDFPAEWAGLWTRVWCRRLNRFFESLTFRNFKSFPNFAFKKFSFSKKITFQINQTGASTWQTSIVVLLNSQIPYKRQSTARTTLKGWQTWNLTFAWARRIFETALESSGFCKLVPVSTENRKSSNDWSECQWLLVLWFSSVSLLEFL